MGTAHAVATKNTKNGAAVSRNHKNAQAVTGIIPRTQTGFSGEQFLVQRKENACSCGGGCPKCLGTLGIQAKLQIGAPNDVYEQEADMVADQVMRTTEPKEHKTSRANANSNGTNTRLLASKADVPVQRQKEVTQEDEGEELIRLKALNQPVTQRQTDLDEDEEDLLQAKANLGHTPQVTPNSAANIHSLKGGGQPLPSNQRTFFESRMGQDFNGVRIHTDSKAADTAQTIQAKAFTLGHDIVFNAGQYSHDNQVGKKLLAHELTHVVQQNGGASVGPKKAPPLFVQKPQKSQTKKSAKSKASRLAEATLPAVQFSFKVNEPGDAYEQNVDRVPPHVMRAAEPQVQRQPEEEEEDILRIKTAQTGDQRRKLFQVGYHLNQFRKGVRDLSRTAKALGDKNPLTGVEIRRLNRIYRNMPAWGKKNIDELAGLIEQRQPIISDEDSTFVQLTSEKIVLGMRNETILAAGAMLKINDQFHKFVRLDDSAVDTVREIAGLEILDLKGFSKAKKMGEGMISQAQFESFGKFIDAMQEASASDEMIKRTQAEGKAYKIQEEKRKAAINDALVNGPKRKTVVPYATAHIIGKSFGVADIKPEEMENLLRGNVKDFLKTITRNELGVKGKEEEALQRMATLFSLNNQVAVEEREKDDISNKNWGYIEFMMAEAQLQSAKDREVRTGFQTSQGASSYKTSKRHVILLKKFKDNKLYRRDFEDLMDVARGTDTEMSTMRDFFIEKAIDAVAGKIIMITIEIEMVLLGGAALRAAKTAHGAVRVLATVSEVSGLAVAANELPEQASSIFGNSYDAKTGLEHAGVSRENSKKFTAIASIVSLGTGGVGGILKWRHTRNLEKAGRLVKALEADSIEGAADYVRNISKAEAVAAAPDLEKLVNLAISESKGRKGFQVMDKAAAAKGVGSKLDETIDTAVTSPKQLEAPPVAKSRAEAAPLAKPKDPLAPVAKSKEPEALVTKETGTSPNYAANDNAAIGPNPPIQPQVQVLPVRQPQKLAAGAEDVEPQIVSSTRESGSSPTVATAGDTGDAAVGAITKTDNPQLMSTKGAGPISPRKKLAEETPKLRKPRTPDEEFADFEKWRTVELGATGPMTSDELLQMYRHGSRATVAKYLRRYLQKQAAQSGLMTVGNMSRKVKPGVPLNEQVHDFVKSLEGAHFTPQSFSKKLPKEVQEVLPGGKYNAADTLVTLTDKLTHTAMDQPWKDAFKTMRASGIKKITGQKVFDEVADGIRKTPGMSDSEIASRIARLEDEMFTELGILRRGIEYPIPNIYNWWEILAFKAGKK